MKRILAYNVRDDERAAIRAWEQGKGVRVDVTRDILTAETVRQAKGYDGICIQQPVPVNDPDIYSYLRQNGFRQLSTRTAGIDMIDVKAASDNGLIVTHVPAYSPNAIAELAVMQALQLIRNMPAFQRRIGSRDFRWDGLLGREMRSMTVGIVGTGRIGAVAARLYKGFGSGVIGYDVCRNRELQDVLEYTDTLEELMRRADIVSLHLPLMESNRHMINRTTLSWMKPDAYLVNTSRGGLVHTGDLLDAVEAGAIAGAALDTIEEEGPFFNRDCSGQASLSEDLERMLRCERILLTPHVGFYTDIAVDNIVSSALDSVLEVLETGTSPNAVNAGVCAKVGVLQ